MPYGGQCNKWEYGGKIMGFGFLPSSFKTAELGNSVQDFGHTNFGLPQTAFVKWKILKHLVA